MNSIHDMDLNLLKLLDMVFETRNLTKAGKRLGLTQSAVSHALKRLRSSFDDQLVLRQGNRLELTSRGEEIEAPLRKWLNDFEHNVLSSQAFNPTTSNRHFTICTADLSEHLHIPTLTKRLSKVAPDITLTIAKWHVGQVSPALENGTYDLALGVSLSSTAGIMQKPLYDETFCSIARKDHEYFDGPQDIHAYINYPHVLVSTGIGGKGVVDRALDKHGLERRVQYRLANFGSAPILVESSNAILTGPRRFLEEATKRYKVKLFEPPLDVGGYQKKMFWSERNHHDTGLKWLRDQIADVTRLKTQKK